VERYEEAKRVYEADPRNAVARTRLAYCLQFLAEDHLAQRRESEALDSALESRDLLAELTALDPANVDLASSLRRSEQLVDEAEALLRRAGGAGG